MPGDNVLKPDDTPFWLPLSPSRFRRSPDPNSWHEHINAPCAPRAGSSWPMPLENRFASEWKEFALAVGVIRGPLHSNSANPTDASSSWISQAAAVMLPADMLARNTSACSMSMAPA